jgi:hypothetical protein
VKADLAAGVVDQACGVCVCVSVWASTPMTAPITGRGFLPASSLQSLLLPVGRRLRLAPAWVETPHGMSVMSHA